MAAHGVVPWMADGLQVLVILTLSLLIHEYSHVMAARSVGSEATDVTVFIFGGRLGYRT